MLKFISKLGFKGSKAALGAQMAQGKLAVKLVKVGIKIVMILAFIIGLLILRACMPSWNDEEVATIEEPTITTAQQLEASVEARLMSFEQQMTARFGPIIIEGSEDKSL